MYKFVNFIVVYYLYFLPLLVDKSQIIIEIL